MCHANNDLICEALRQHPDLTTSDLRVFDALLSNPYLLQSDIANLLGLGVRTVKRSVDNLKTAGLIEVKRIYDRTRRKTINNYLPQDQGAKDGALPQDQGAKDGALPQPEASQVPKGDQGAKDGTHDHDELNHHDNEDSLKEILGLLDWVEGRNRQRLARLPHVTADYARQAREWFASGMWPERVKDPAAYLIAIMLKGDPIPALQFTLPAGETFPAGAIELPPGDPLFAALAEVCRYDPGVITKSQRGQINQAAKVLRDQGRTPVEVKAFEAWWYKNDWRGKKGDAPTLSQIRNAWGKFIKSTLTVQETVTTELKQEDLDNGIIEW